MRIKCGNCQKLIRSEEELKCVFPHIPDLLDRISPGELVPIGECPDCGALVHVVDDPPTLRCNVCNGLVEESQLREHLAAHHPGAEQLDWEEVRDQFRLQACAADHHAGSGTVQRMLDVIGCADVLVLADSPYLHSVQTDNPTGDPDNEVLRATWHDAEGLQFEVKFTEAGLLQARIKGHIVIAEDHEGEETKIELFRLEPLEIKSMK